MSLLGVQGFAITRIEHTGKAKAALQLQRLGIPMANYGVLGDEE
jgi:hypothetical protein